MAIVALKSVLAATGRHCVKFFRQNNLSGCFESDRSCLAAAGLNTMLIRPAELLSLCRAIEETSENWKFAADRESLLAIHRALMNLNQEIERALSQLPEGESALN